MAKKFKKMASIKDTEGGNFGGYDEYNGGGSPKGGVWGGTNGRVGWEERKKQGEVSEYEHREDQPRTKDGKFTYNSVNGKETKYDGRGETVNPLLTGGENGVYIKDVDKRGKTHSGVESQFKNKSGALYDKYKGKWHPAGGMKVTKEGKKYTIKIAANDLWELAKYRFDIKTGEFAGKQNKRKGIDVKSESEQFAQTKMGAPGAAGTAAKQLAKKTGQEQFVTTSEGAIAKFKDANSAAGMAGKLGLKAKKDIALKHSPAQIKQARDLLSKAGYDTSAFTDEQIDAIVDDYITF